MQRKCDIIDDCIYRINGLALQKGITINKEQFDTNILIRGSEELISKVLENLLSNAVRYAKKEIIISVLSDNDIVTISVKDDGKGISESDLPHVFERCYKGDGGNFGIGLAIAFSAVKKMNGRIEASNRPEGGAVFSLYLYKYFE